MVSSAEIVRNFGLWQDRASHAPVVVTNRGRPRYVLVSFDAWRQADEQANMPALPTAPEHCREAEFAALIERMPGGFLILDDHLHVRATSTAAALLIGQPVEVIRGAAIDTLLDRIGIGIALAALHRVLETGEETRFDLPLPGGDAQRIRGHASPWLSGIALTLHHYHEPQEDRWLVEQRALEHARSAHRGVFVLRLSVRGTITSVDDRTAAYLGLPRERILQARLVDLLALSARAAARDAVETILSGAAPAVAFDSLILTNGGEQRRVAISLAPVAEGFAVGGAMVLMTASIP